MSLPLCSQEHIFYNLKKVILGHVLRIHLFCLTLTHSWESLASCEQCTISLNIWPHGGPTRTQTWQAHSHSFTQRAPPATMVDTEAELRQLRSKMEEAQIKAFVIPMDDAHQVCIISSHLKFSENFTYFFPFFPFQNQLRPVEAQIS